MVTRNVLLNFTNDAGDLCLRSVTIVVEPDLPLALVHYSENGVESELGMRIDLDKMAFLDNFDNPAHDLYARSMGPRIVREVYEQVYAPLTRPRASSAHTD